MEMSVPREGGDDDTGNRSAPLELVKKTTDQKSSRDEDDPLLENWGVITIEDEEDERKRLEGAEELVCLRCPSKEAGTFRSREKFILHIQRHTLGEVFICTDTKCGKRTFETFIECLAHEIREHGLTLTYKTSNPLIQKAKQHAERKMRRQANLGNGFQVGGASNPEQISSSDSEQEVIPSTSVSFYRGPKVTHILQCYEIHLNYSNKKENAKTEISKVAMNAHKRNIRRKSDKNKLGRFFNPKNPEKPEEPKRKRKVFFEYVTMSSSSDSEVDYGISDVEGLDLQGGIPYLTRARLMNFRNLRMSSCPTQNKAKNFSSGLSTRKCQKCSYTWKTEDDLRVHRDQIHSNLTLEDLMDTPGNKNVKVDTNKCSKAGERSSSASSNSENKRKPKTSPKKGVKSPAKRKLYDSSSSSDSDSEKEEKSVQKNRKKRLQRKGKKKTDVNDNSNKWNLKEFNINVKQLSLQDIASYQKKDQPGSELN